MVSLRTKSKRSRFNETIVQKNWGTINEGPLKRAGLLIRQIMRRSIRRDNTKSQRPSKPGRPPKSRAPGAPFKRIFSVPTKTDVVVGHEGLGQRMTPMEIHEFGKRAKVRSKVTVGRRRATSDKQRRHARRLFLAGRIRPKPRVVQERVVKFPSRPFAKPALDKSLPQIPPMWRGSFTNATVKN